MMQKITAILAAFAFTAATLTPVAANAQRHDGWSRHGGYYNCYDGRRDRCDRYGDRRGRYHRHRDRDNDGEIAAGVIGLVLGAVIASAVIQSNNNSNDARYADDRYYDDYDSRAAYERDYGLEGGPYASGCTQQMRRWDEQIGQYVIVHVPC